MTGAGLPPIAIEAVLKLLAIGQESAKTRKMTKPAGKPAMRLELTPAAEPFAPPQRAAATRAVSRAAPRRKPGLAKPAIQSPTTEGAESC